MNLDRYTHCPLCGWSLEPRANLAFAGPNRERLREAHDDLPPIVHHLRWVHRPMIEIYVDDDKDEVRCSCRCGFLGRLDGLIAHLNEHNIAMHHAELRLAGAI